MAHCVCYLLLHNEPSQSLGRVSGVQPLSSWPAFDLGVEMQLKRPHRSCGDGNTHPRVLLLGSSLRRSKENNTDTLTRTTHTYAHALHRWVTVSNYGGYLKRVNMTAYDRQIESLSKQLHRDVQLTKFIVFWRETRWGRGSRGETS